MIKRADPIEALTGLSNKVMAWITAGFGLIIAWVGMLVFTHWSHPLLIAAALFPALLLWRFEIALFDYRRDAGFRGVATIEMDGVLLGIAAGVSLGVGPALLGGALGHLIGLNQNNISDMALGAVVGAITQLHFPRRAGDGGGI